MRRFLAAFAILFSTLFLTGGSDLHYVIDAEMNAVRHNNMGLAYLRERYYFGAIEEFKMAISLNPNTQASAVYYNNLGRTYVTIGYPEIAEGHFRNAIRKYPLNFEYYKNLVETYGKQNKLPEMLAYHRKNKKSKLDDITVALIYGAKGNTRTEITLLDDFVNTEPNLIIIPAIKRHIKEEAELLNYDEKSYQ